MNEIPLRRRDGIVRACVLVDDHDFERLGNRRWCLASNGYAVARVNGQVVLLHRELLGLQVGDPCEVDHINGDRLDNRRANLRLVTREVQSQNCRPHRDGSSRYRGVSRLPSGRWRAQVKSINLGTYDTQEEAAEVAAQYRQEHLPHSAEALAAA